MRVKSGQGVVVPTSVLAVLVLATCADPPMAPDESSSAAAVSAVLSLQPAVVNAPVILLAAGDIASCTSTGDERTLALLDTLPGTIFTLGDNVYENGTAQEYADCYEPGWGRHKARTWASIGNHEYNVDRTAAATFDYFGERVGPRGKGYYSLDLGDWHIVVLNDNREFISYSAGSEQERWLTADLAANSKKCTMAIWHRPTFYSGSGASPGVETKQRILWDRLYAAGADVILNGHQHHYERFAPQNPAGARDLARGIRQFIVGTGGGGYGMPSRIQANSELVWAGFGILKLTLGDGTYSWEYIPVAGMKRPINESGSGACHNASTTPNQPPVADAGGPYTGVEGSAVAFDGSASSDPDADLPLSYAWSFGDGATGTGATPTHAYADDGSRSASLTVTDARSGSSLAATAAVSISNVAPTVNAGADVEVGVGSALNLSATFTDPGASDAPWTYTIDWGDGSTTTGSTSSRSTPITASHSYAAVGTYTVGVTVDDKDGGTGSDALTATVSTAPPPPASEVLVGAGGIARCDRQDDEATAALLDGIAGTVFTIGDHFYRDGVATEMAGCYGSGTSWGRHKARTRPSIGHKEYTIAGAASYFDYFGAAAGERGKGYYSFDLGAWHVVVLNGITEQVALSAGSAQLQWLQADLAATAKQCTIAIWDRPRFYSASSATSTGLRSEMKPAWDALYAAGAELVVNAHQYTYERFAPQRPDGTADAARGIRQFIVGTGGHRHDEIAMVRANSEVRNKDDFGVLKLTLEANGYSWQFIGVGGTVLDAGSGTCH